MDVYGGKCRSDGDGDNIDGDSDDDNIDGGNDDDNIDGDNDDDRILIKFGYFWKNFFLLFRVRNRWHNQKNL